MENIYYIVEIVSEGVFQVIMEFETYEQGVAILSTLNIQFPSVTYKIVSKDILSKMLGRHQCVEFNLYIDRSGVESKCDSCMYGEDEDEPCARCKHTGWGGLEDNHRKRK